MSEPPDDDAAHAQDPARPGWCLLCGCAFPCPGWQAQQPDPPFINMISEY
ncbi:MAG: hypothetical protein L0Y54_11895 [Sporichthyaceae bacterium]|nr:hypothetical protein [Sporichthyaceae bacterium]